MLRNNSELRYGRIVWATLRDNNGYRKDRPAIILTATDEIRPDEPIVVMAITTTFRDPPPDNHIPLPYNPDPRRVGTGLAQRSAAVTNWLDTLYSDEILDIKGDVPPKLMNQIQEQLRARKKDADDSPLA